MEEGRRVWGVVLMMLSALPFCTMQGPVGWTCPEGWTGFQNSCYVYIAVNPATWSGAQTICGLLGGHLPEIGSAAENRFLKTRMRALSVYRAWIGLNDLVAEGDFRWATHNTPVGYSNWRRWEPNNGFHHGGDQDCVTIDSHGTWDDDHCEHWSKHVFFCEMDELSH